jgi:hypothetical protein
VKTAETECTRSLLLSTVTVAVCLAARCVPAAASCRFWDNLGRRANCSAREQQSPTSGDGVLRVSIADAEAAVGQSHSPSRYRVFKGEACRTSDEGLQSTMAGAGRI